MKIVVDRIPTRDETYSRTGQKDFTPQLQDVKELPAVTSTPKPRTRASQNNSYT